MFCNSLVYGGYLEEFFVLDDTPKPEIYLVLEGMGFEAAQFLGALKASPTSMMNLVEWLMPGYPNAYCLLVSSDGKRGQVVARAALDECPTVVRLPTEDDYFPEELGRMVRDFKNYMQHNPDLAQKIGYQLPGPRIKKRVNFEVIRRDFAPGDMHAEIVPAMNDPKGASDDALVWLMIAGQDGQAAPYIFDYSEARKELERRIRDRYSNGWTFFFAPDLTMKEVNARVARASATYDKFRDFFAPPQTPDDVRISRWVKRLNDDVLAELTVYAFYSPASHSGRWKYLLGELQSRFPGYVPF